MKLTLNHLVEARAALAVALEAYVQSRHLTPAEMRLVNSAKFDIDWVLKPLLKDEVGVAA